MSHLRWVLRPIDGYISSLGEWFPEPCDCDASTSHDEGEEVHV